MNHAKNFGKRAMSLILAVMMVLAIFPMSVFAANVYNATETGRDTTKDQVRVIVENTTFTEATDDSNGEPAWSGRLVDQWVDIDNDSTMMSCVVAALDANEFEQTGAENNYISTINGLSEMDGGFMSGWMGTLNDWFTNEGFAAFTVANGKLTAGDQIAIMYTTNGYGADLGGSWENTDTSVIGISFSEGTLDKTFASDVYVYTLTVPAGVESIYVEPTAANKNYQVRTFIGETEYKRTALVPVANGTVITVKCGDPSWPSMNGKVDAHTYTFTVSQESESKISTEISLANIASGKLWSKNDENKTDLLGSETLKDKKYTVSLDAGEYVFEAFDSEGASFGTIELPVSESSNAFTLYKVNVTCGNEGWVAGEDYTVEASAVSGGSEASVKRVITLGADKKSFLCFEGDNVSAKIIPSAAKKSEGYAFSIGANVVTGAGFAEITATCGKAANFSVTYPYADKNSDGKNDYVLEVGTLTNYYIYSYYEPEFVSEPAENKVTAEFSGLSAGDYFYRVTNKIDDDAVTYGNYKTLSVGANSAEVTEKMLYVGDDSFDKNTVIKDFSKNSWDVADIYLSVNGDLDGTLCGYNGAAGQLSLKTNDNVTLYPYRNWLAIESFINSKVTEPDFDVQVLNVEGTPVEVTENTENNAKKHSFNIEAKSEGTAILLVTYDAMTHMQDNSGASMGNIFSAIWPENTGVIVVTVDKNGGVATNMVINEKLNKTQENKYAVEKYDAELDVLYYYGNDGAAYTFKPEENTTVTMAVSSYDKDGNMTFGEFSNNGVKVAEDGTVTLSGLTEGKTIVKLAKDGKVNYQVLRAIHTDVVVTDANGKVFMDTEKGIKDESIKFVGGDTVNVTFSKLYHPANKLSGIYNMSAATVLEGQDGETAEGTANQYLFAFTDAAHKVSFKLPDSFENSYTIGGYLNATGFGSYYGYHRLLCYETGKTANFSALKQNGYMGSLPEIVLSKASEVEVILNIKNDKSETVSSADLSVFDFSGKAVDLGEGGSFKAFAGKPYNVVVSADGYAKYMGSLTFPESETVYNAVVTLETLGEGMWDGKTKTEPAQKEDVYQIGTGAELAWFAEKVNDGTAAGANAVLTADIDLANFDWVPIGTSTNKYTGTFDGQGHIINRLYISSTATYQGLFGYVNNGTIKNLGVKGQVKGGNYSAGIVAYLAGTGKVETSFNAVNVTGGKWSGGIAGFQNAQKAIIENCYNLGDINGGSNQYVGGISGCGTNQVVKCVITNCYNLGTVYSTTTYGGSINGGTQVGSITNCYYLEGTWTGTATSNVNKAGAAKKADELKALAETLGEAFVADTYGVNGGFPILKWQVPKKTPADYKDILDNTLKQLSETVKEPKMGTNGGEWTVLALARGGYYDANSDYFKGYYNRIKEEVVKLAGSVNKDGALNKNKSTENARVILALSAIGKDPRNVGGVDLVEAYSKNGMSWIKKQGINGVIFALISLDTKDFAVTDTTLRETCVKYLLDNQKAGGGWALTGDKSDVDICAMALQALAKYKDNTDVCKAAEKAFGVLSEMQNTDGSFSYGGNPTSESIAQVITACCAWGIDPDTDPRFVKNGVSAVDAILGYYIEDGKGFAHVMNNVPGYTGGEVNAMATDQAAYALVAFDRFKNNKTSLYDMSDVEFVDKVSKTIEEEVKVEKDEPFEYSAETTDKDTNEAKITIPATVAEKLKDASSMELKTDMGAIVFDNDALKTIFGGNESVEIAMSTNESTDGSIILELTATDSEGNNLFNGQNGGKATVNVKVAAPEGKEDYFVYYVNGGKYEKVEAELNENGELVVELTHFSEYKIMKFILGDVDGEDGVNSLDAMYAYAYFNNPSIIVTDLNLFAADVDGDGEIGSYDAFLIYAYHNGLITSFEEE